MRVTAARLVEHGQPLVVEEVELADPGADEVLVDLEYAGVNPVDRYGALGRVAPNGPVPRTLGGEAVARVDGRLAVVLGHGLGAARDGVWASAAVVPRAALVEVPDGVDPTQAAGAGVAGVTAWHAVQEASVEAGDRVLVLGASGGVGSLIVSLARGLGATVWGQTTSPAKAEWLGEHGADHVVVSEADGLVEAAGEFQPTVVFDPLGGDFFGAAVLLLAERGRLVLFGTSANTEGLVPLQPLYRKGLTVYTYAGLIQDDDAVNRDLRAVLDELASGRLTIPIDTVLPLTRVNEAFERLVNRSLRGKLVLDLSR